MVIGDGQNGLAYVVIFIVCCPLNTLAFEKKG